MASRVNTKFVILLAGVLFVLFAGVAGLAVYAKYRSGERLIRQGDAALAAGDYEEASKKYSRAVSRDQSRTDWLIKWQDALLQTTPDNTATYQKAYKERYMSILSKLASLSPTDPEPQIEFVKEFDRYLRLVGGNSLSGYQQIVTLVDERANQLDPEDPKTKELMAYRGRAIVDQMLRVSVDQELVDKAEEDLTEAIAVNPNDYESALALVQWYYAAVDLARRDVRQAEAEAALKEFRSQLADLVAKHGSVPEVRVFAFRIEALEAQRKAVTIEDRRKMQETLRPAAQATLDVLAAADASALDAGVLNQAARILTSFVGPEGQTQFLEILQRVVAARPEDPDALIMLGQMLASQQQFSDAYDAFERVANLPNKPVSLEGMLLPDYRRVAVQSQVDMLLAQYEQSKDDAQRAQFLAQAKTRRDMLKTLTDVNSEDELKLRDAQIAYIEGDNAQTVVLLQEIRRNLSSDNARVQRLLALALTRQGNLGEAARQYERLAADDQATATDYTYLGDCYFQLNDTEKALRSYRQALRLNPDYPVALQRVAAIEQATGRIEGGLIDPIIEALMEAQRLSREGDTDGAIKALADAQAKAPDDYRLIRELAARYVAADRRSDAATLVSAALQRNPSNANLLALNKQVTIEDPVKAAEAIIDSLDKTPVEKAVMRFSVYERNGDRDKATEAFAEAERLDANNPDVIEIGFLRALSQGGADGFKQAATYATRAAEHNVDRVGGLTYKGRLELARGDTREAESTLKRAVERNPFDPQSWRWLGQAQRQSGKVEAALQSFERAYQQRPGHTGIAEDYSRALVANGQGDKALEITRKAVGQADRSPRLVSFWLDLEAQYGDRTKALESRRKIFEGDPTDVANCIAYLNLLIIEKNFEGFESAMGVLEKGDTFTPLQIAGLRARALAENGKREEGRALLTKYINAIPADQVSVETYMTLGRFEREYGTLNDAIAAYEKARPYETADLREADRALGDLHFAAAQSLATAAAQDPSGESAKQMMDHFEKAADSYKRVHEADLKDIGVSKRLAETLIRLDNYEEAKTILTSVGNDDDIQVLLLRSVIAQTGGDMRSARDFLNRAVELYPNDPIPFYRRADLNKTDVNLFPDVIADLDQATKLRPAMVEAWALRFQLYESRDQMDQAFAQLSSAIDANPESDALKRLLVRSLVAYDRPERARAEVQKIANANWDNVAWLQDAAVISYRQDSFDEAKKYYARLFELSSEPLSAADLLNAWFRANSKPSRPEVNRLLTKVQEIKLDDVPARTKVVTLMLQARAQHWLGEKALADQLTFQSYEEAKKATAAESRIWFDDLVERFHTADSDGNKEAYAFLRDNASKLGELPAIVELLVIRNDMIGGTPLPQCDARVTALAPRVGQDPYSRLEYARMKNQLYYAMGRFEDCATACRDGLEISPTDLELNNNLAYVLAKHLKDPAAALPYAEAAAAAAPLNAAVLDTLGWVYFEAGRFRDADRVLGRAITTAKTPDELVPAYLHLAQTKKATGDMQEARKYIILANQEIAKASQMIKDQYLADVKALFAELNP